MESKSIRMILSIYKYFPTLTEVNIEYGELKIKLKGEYIGLVDVHRFGIANGIDTSLVRNDGLYPKELVKKFISWLED